MLLQLCKACNINKSPRLNRVGSTLGFLFVCCCLVCESADFLVFFVLDDIFHIAVEYSAKFVYRECADKAIFAEPVNLPCANVVVLYEFVLRDFFLLHRLP